MGSPFSAVFRWVVGYLSGIRLFFGGAGKARPFPSFPADSWAADPAFGGTAAVSAGKDRPCRSHSFPHVGRGQPHCSGDSLFAGYVRYSAAYAGIRYGRKSKQTSGRE